MSHLSPEAVKHHVKIYIRVFAALAVLTMITVGVSYLHLATVPAVVLALSIAILKASLVALFFMHLAGERKIIYAILALTVFFFVFLLIYPSIFHV
jgi:cytochrome c oxidase subunit 4